MNSYLLIDKAKDPFEYSATTQIAARKIATDYLFSTGGRGNAGILYRFKVYNWREPPVLILIGEVRASDYVPTPDPPGDVDLIT